MLRFSQSPKGDMTMSDLQVALINYLVAQQKEDAFIVRIADLDKANIIEGKDTEIMQILEKFALIHQQVFHQSEHLHMHQTLAIRLLEEKKAFICTCYSHETLRDQRPCQEQCVNKQMQTYRTLKEQKVPFVIRLKSSQTQPKEPILLYGDATPSELFASACDDMLNGIDCIIDTSSKKEEQPLILAIQEMLGYSAEVAYAYLPPLENDPTIESLFIEGFIPDAIVNYLLRLSNPQAPQTIFTFPDAIEWFDLKQLPTEPIVFDKEALRTINQAHLMLMDNKQLSSLFGFADADVGKLAKLYLDKSATINELAQNIRPFFAPTSFQSPWEEEMKTLQSILQEAPMIHSFEAFEAMLIQKSGLNKNDLQTPLRLLLTGSDNGPELSRIYPLIKPYLLEVIS